MINLIAIIVPFLGLLSACLFFWGRGFTWADFGLLIGMYLTTALGISVGYHRLFTHRAFKTNGVVKVIFAILGSMAMEGPILRWVATHRRHHQYSDHDEDPHSPHLHGEGFFGVIRGLWHAHVGWIMEPDAPNLTRYVNDLIQDKVVRRVSGLWSLWAILGLAVPTLVGGLVGHSWTGAFCGFLWGGLARIFLVHHVTWSINSVCHLWGSQPYKSHDESRNNPIFGLLALGEGWHNNHHAFPTSAKHGLRWWQFDASYLVIWMLERLGLAWDVKVPAPHAMAAKRRA